MIIDVDKLPKEGLRISREFEFFSSDLVDEDAVFLEPVRAELTIKKIGEEIFVKGKVATRLSFVCSRCLSPFEYPIDSRFDLVFLPEELNVVKDELEEKDIDKFFYSGCKIDIEDLVLEQLNLAFPAKPLCSNKCQGLCPVCGRVIKDGECACVTKSSDPRFGKLKDFLRDKR
jgi:uncharacterized protein